MSRSKVVVVWLCAALCSAAGMARTGEPVAAAPDAGALTEQLEELKEREDEAREKRDELLDEVRQSPQLVPPREAYDRAEAAYQDRKKTDEVYLSAVKAEQQAREGFEKVVKDKLAAEAKLLFEKMALIPKSCQALAAEDPIGQG